jgi:hypothetical protein
VLAGGAKNTDTLSVLAVGISARQHKLLWAICLPVLRLPAKTGFSRLDKSFLA